MIVCELWNDLGSQFEDEHEMFEGKHDNKVYETTRFA